MKGILLRLRPHIGLLLALAIGLGLRLANIAAEPYWGDEILSLDIATRSSSAGEMLRYIAGVEFHPPLYYLILRPWTALFGTAEAATRSISVLAGVGTIAAAYVASRNLFRSSMAANVAALLIAVLPIQVEFGQEARPYALVALAATIGTAALWTGLRKRSVPALIVYGASMLAAIYLHYSGFFVLFGTASWWLVEIYNDEPRNRWHSFTRWLVVHGAIFLGFYPWLEALFYKLSLSRFEFFGRMRFSSDVRPPAFAGQMIDMVIYTTTQGGYQLIEILAQSLAKLAVMAGGIVAVRSLGPHALRDRDGNGWAACYVVWLAVVPATAFIMSPLSIVYAPLWVRHIIFLSVPIALFIGFIASRLPSRPALAFTALMCVSLVPTLAGVLGNDAEWDHYHRIGEVGNYIAEHARPGDIVIVAFSAVRSDLAHYLPDDLPVVSMLPVEDYGNDIFGDRHRLGLLENEGQVRSGRISAQEGSATAIGGTAGMLEDTTVAAVQDKLRRLVAMHDARRVWLYSFSAKDTFVHGWFRDRGWRHAFSGIEGIFALDLYAMDGPASEGRH